MKKKRNVNGSDIVYLAVKTGGKGDIESTLQKQHVNLEGTDKLGNTILHLLLENQILTDKEIFKFVQDFLNYGVDPNTPNNKRETSLHLAVARRLKDVIELLIQYNAKVNPKITQENRHDKLITHHFIRDEHEKFRHILELNNEQLHFWYNDNTESESVKYLEWLMEIGFDFDAEEKQGQTAIHLAIDCNLLHILPTLLKTTSHKDFLLEDYKPLFRVLTEKNFLIKPYFEKYYFEIIQTLLDRRLSFAINSDEDAQFIETWIKEYLINIDSRKCATSLFLAIMRNCKNWCYAKADNNIKILNELISRGVNINSEKMCARTPLILAIEGYNICALEFLEQNGVDFRVKIPNGQNLLGLLAKKDFDNDRSEEVFEFLVSRGCDVNDKDNYGWSVLHSAVAIGNTKLVSKLIQHGAIVDCRDNNFKTPLHYAVKDGNSLELTQILLQNGANVNAKDYEGSRPLFRAIYTPVADLLLDWGAVIDTLNIIDEWLCLDYLIDQMTIHKVKMLLDYGIEVNNTSYLGRALLKFCTSTPNNEQYLMQHWIRLKLANLLSSEDRKRYIPIDEKNEFIKGCLNEIKELTKVSNDGFSLYDFLHMDLNRKCNYTTNQNLMDIVKEIVRWDGSKDMKMKFIEYGYLILADYRKAVARKPLVEPAMRAWIDLTGVRLPNVCIERIIAHLGNSDLLAMINRD